MGSDKEVKVVGESKQTTHAYIAQNTKKPVAAKALVIPEKKSSPPKYPVRGNRYYTLGWNHNYQDCYDKNDVTLLKKIKNEYENIKEKNKEDHHFDLNEEKAMHDWWTCQRPANSGAMPGVDGESYTLPSREAKDEKQFPLWHYADSMARQIANWQAERIKNQDIHLMNDPVNLAFDEIRDWLFHELSSKECKKEVLDYISARQSYIKHLIHMVPNFGPDRLNLHELQHSLEDASRIITHCVASKELPQLLSELTVKSSDLETATATYLHFLLINQEVADNLAPTHLEGSTKNCASSPVCTVYKMAQNSDATQVVNTDLMSPNQSNQFYDIKKISSNQYSTQYELTLKTSLADNIKFATFVNTETKEKYIQSMAMLESLSKVRETLNKFQHVQSRIGTYIFAMNYLDQVDQLSGNYINLVGKVGALMKDIITSADDGLNMILIKQGRMHLDNQQFEKNLRSLETRVAKGVTTSALLDTYCKNSIDSMNKYQLEIKKLVRSVQSGDAARELAKDMKELYNEMANLNAVLPAILQDQKHLTISNPDFKANKMLSLTDNAGRDNSALELPCNAQDSTCTLSAPKEDTCGLNDDKDIFDPDNDPFQQHSGAESSRVTPPLFAPVKLLANYAAKAISWLSPANPQPTNKIIPDSTSMINMAMTNSTVITPSSQHIAPITPMLTPGKVFPKMIAATASETENKQETHQKYISQVSYNSPLTLNEWIYVGQFIGHYIRKYSPYTFPWNRVHDLTEEEISHLHKNSRSLQKLIMDFNSQKHNVAAESGIFTDQFDYMEKNMKLLEKHIHRSLTSTRSTSYFLNDIDAKLSRVDEMAHNISMENHALKKLLAKGKRIKNHGKIPVITKNTLTNELTLTSTDSIETKMRMT